MGQRLQQLEGDLGARGQQVEELQARQRLAQSEWTEQLSSMQRLHMDKEIFLLNQVDHNLLEEHGLEVDDRLGVDTLNTPKVDDERTEASSTVESSFIDHS